MIVTEEEKELARQGSLLLLKKPNKKLRVEVGRSQSILLPASVRHTLEQALGFVADGRAVKVVPEDAELTTQQLADMLFVSRPFAVKLLENGELPFRKVGKHRRVLVEDARRYKEQLDNKRLDTLNKLAAQAQKLDLGY